jgi:hypothetical protein
MSSDPRVLARVQDALSASDLSLPYLFDRAEQVILFGSSANKCFTKDSDVDILCVGSGTPLRTSSLHLLWIPPPVARTSAWGQGELATHLHRYGIWLKGERGPNLADVPSKDAACDKRRRVLGRSSMLLQSWDELTSEFQARQITRVRRDLQRLSLLFAGEVIPPTPLLNRDWQAMDDPIAWARHTFIRDPEVRLVAEWAFELAGQLGPDQSQIARSLRVQGRLISPRTLREADVNKRNAGEGT